MMERLRTWPPLMAVLASAVMCGCHTVREVATTASVTHDTLYQYRLRVDSVYQHDSVYVAQRGDTVYIDKTHIKYRYINLTDTVYRSHTDTLRVTEVREVEKRLTVADKAKITLQGLGVLAAIVAAIGAAVWLVRRWVK